MSPAATLGAVAASVAFAALVCRLAGWSSMEFTACAVHLSAAMLVNAGLIWAVRRQRTPFLASPAAAFVAVSQTYMTLAGLKYLDPNLLFPEFGLTLPQRLVGSLAAEAVLLLAVLGIGSAATGPTHEEFAATMRGAWRDVKRLVPISVAASAGIKAVLVGRGYGSAYSGAAFTTVVTRSYLDLVGFLLSDLGTVAVLSLGVVVAVGRRFGPASVALRAFAAAGVLGEIAYSLLFLQARLLLLTAALFGMFAIQTLRPRFGERLLLWALFLLAPLSLLGPQLTIAIGRVNIAAETGVRLAATFVNGRADLTDFATAILVNGGPSAYEPSIAGVAVINGIPRAVLPGKDALIRDVYSELLGRLGWAAGSGEQMTRDYQDSIFSAGQMSSGPAGWLIVPLGYVLALAVAGRAVRRLRRPAVVLCATLAVTLAATHIEMEWATIVLNARQAVTYAALLMACVAGGRAAVHVLRVAGHAPAASGRSLSA